MKGNYYRKLINQSRVWFPSRSENKNDVRNTRTRLKNKLRKNVDTCEFNIK